MTSNATRASLLLEIRDRRNELAWSEFVSIYMPLLHGYAMKTGLQDSDAADLAQDTLREVMNHIFNFILNISIMWIMMRFTIRLVH